MNATLCLFFSTLLMICRCSTIGDRTASNGKNFQSSQGCDAGFVSHPNNNSLCIKLATKIEDSCDEDDAQCNQIPGASCIKNSRSSKACKCDLNEGRIENFSRTVCLDVVKELHKPCEESVQCFLVENTNCDQHRCECDLNYVESKLEPGTCTEVASTLNSACSEDGQCSVIEGATCIHGICQCDSQNEVGNGNQTKCLPVATLNQSCEESVQCKIENSECVAVNGSQICKCQGENGYIQSQNNSGLCIKMAAELNSQCSEDIQCFTVLGDYSSCDNGQCDCSEDSFKFNNQCLKPVYYGQTCNYTSECVAGAGNNSFCDASNTCACFPFSQVIDNKCIAEKRAEDPCSTDEDCVAFLPEKTFCNISSGTCMSLREYNPPQPISISVSGEGCIHPNILMLAIIITVSFLKELF